jgi:DNA-binding Lrp family transcriptional regulator
MDEIDRRIVSLLREDARRSFGAIGHRVHLSAPAVKRRIDRLRADGVIRGYTAVIDPAAYGWTTEAFVSLYCDGRMPAAEIRHAVEAEPEVVAAYTVAGESSAILHVMAADTKHLEEALERIRSADGVIRTRTQVVLSELLRR